MPEFSKNTFWNTEFKHWLQFLNSTESGLNSEQIQLLESKKTTKHIIPRWKKDVMTFISQFKSPLMLLLIGAVILSAFLGDTTDVFIILFIVLSTGTLSFIQERNAGRVVEKLQSLISLKSIVIRNGIKQEILSKNILSGDVLSLKAGDIIPADCLIIEDNELQVNEATLTGETYPIKKSTGILAEDTELAERTNALWEGTYIVSGKGKALVINTGDDTILGKITESASKEIETSFEKGIREFGYFLMKITLVLSVFIFIVNLINHKDLFESALFALALAVGMAPELLPAITTIAMSAGARRMLAKKVIVKKLSSIQNLGEINLLCTDKTGTITEGAISVSAFVNSYGNDSATVKNFAIWNASLQSGYANPMDEAIKKSSNNSEIKLPLKSIEIPYDFTRKRLSIGIKQDTNTLLISKGAFSEILSICSFFRNENNEKSSIELAKSEIIKKYESFGNIGLRAIGICSRELNENERPVEENMTFEGFVLLQDPVKPGINTTIEALKNLKIGLKIITGDNHVVATSIAKQIGFENPIVTTGASLFQLPENELINTVKSTHIFAEVEPHQKELIIENLRKSYTVAYMGDGINDVSALNAADVGISVDNAVDVAREAADFVLMEKELDVILDGIREGRKTFANTLKYIFINTGSTFGNMFSMATASLLLPFLPMLPKQILLTNFITDFPYLSIASDNVDEEQLESPGKWDLKFIRNYMIIFGIHSSVFDILTFCILYFYFKATAMIFQTGWFIESILTELFILFVVRTHKNFFKSKPGTMLFLLSLLGLGLTIYLPYSEFNKDLGLVALPINQLATMISVVFVYILTADWLKWWYFKKRN